MIFLIDLSKTLDLKLGPGYIKQIDKILDIYQGMPVSLDACLVLYKYFRKFSTIFTAKHIFIKLSYQ